VPGLSPSDAPSPFDPLRRFPATGVAGPAVGGGGPEIWPEGYRAAASISFDVDAESAVLSVHPASATRLGVMSHQAYGPLTGVPRILRLLRRHDLRATFFVPGFTAERFPSVCQQIAEAGHEIAHHSYLHESTQGMARDAEARMIDRGLEALDRILGIRPTGYRAPMWEMNYHTPSLLIERGFAYDSTLMDCEIPYLLADHQHPEAGDLVEIPVHWSLDDWEQYAYVPDVFGSGLIESPAKVLEMWSLELDAFYAEGACFILTNHPFLSGRPSRAAALEQLIERMESLDGLWIAPLDEIARHTRSRRLQPRTFTPPTP
jgi:peptidoglycan-N-acetylglucosamine deacetylase